MGNSILKVNGLSVCITYILCWCSIAKSMKTDIYSGIYYYLLLVNKEVIIPPCTYIDIEYSILVQ